MKKCMKVFPMLFFLIFFGVGIAVMVSGYSGFKMAKEIFDYVFEIGKIVISIIFVLISMVGIITVWFGKPMENEEMEKFDKDNGGIG